MNMRTYIASGLALAAMILAASHPAPAFAVSTLTISSAGDGVFQVQGSGIEDAAALDIVVGYDTAMLANPRVVAGQLIAGAMTAINANAPGVVRMAVVRLTPVRGNGVIAVLSFDRKGSSPGRILSLNAKFSTINGASIPVFARVDNPPDSSTSAENSSPSGEPADGTTSTSRPGAGTTQPPHTTAPVIILAGEPGKTDGRGTAPDGPATKDRENLPADRDRESGKESVTAQTREGVTSGQEARSLEKNLERKIYVQKGILDLFREYKGERTAKALVSLFAQENYTGFRQEPSVALSDGKSLVKVMFTAPPGNKTSSDVAVMGAQLVSIKKDPDKTNTWVVELRPEKSAYRAGFAILQGDMVMVYPLTIAPKVGLAKSGGVTEAELNRYLKERRTAGSSGLDLNNDDRRDYVDDYIFTANYLASAGAAQNSKSN